MGSPKDPDLGFGCDHCGGQADREEGDALRCACGSLLARHVPGGVELKCRRCKRTVGCGMMQLHLGPFTVRMAPDAVSELLATLGRAVAAQAGRVAQSQTPDMAYPLFLAKRGDA